MRPSVLPTRFLLQGFQELLVPVGGGIFQPEIDRIRVGLIGQLVNELLTGKMNLQAHRIPHVRGSEGGGLFDQIRDHLPSVTFVGKVISL